MTSSFRRILGAAIVGALLTGCFGAAAVRPDEAAAAARSFVEHLALNQPDEAWEMLGLTTREAAYGGDASQFASEVDDADWSRVRWEIDREPRSLDTGWAVFVTVEGGSSAIPDFVIGREIAQPWTSADGEGAVTDHGVVLTLQRSAIGVWSVVGPGLDS